MPLVLHALKRAAASFIGRHWRSKGMMALHRIADFYEAAWQIDVEGAEHRVLTGAAEALAQRRVKLLQFEYGAFSIDTRFLLKDFFAVLGGQFEIGKIYPTTVDFCEYDWRKEDFRFANYLCVSRDHPELRRLFDG